MGAKDTLGFFFYYQLPQFVFLIQNSLPKHSVTVTTAWLSVSLVPWAGAGEVEFPIRLCSHPSHWAGMGQQLLPCIPQPLSTSQDTVLCARDLRFNLWVHSIWGNTAKAVPGDAPVMNQKIDQIRRQVMEAWWICWTLGPMTKQEPCPHLDRFWPFCSLDLFAFLCFTNGNQGTLNCPLKCMGSLKHSDA